MARPALDGGNWRGLIPNPHFKFTPAQCILQAALFLGETPQIPDSKLPSEPAKI
ncbi:MAG: hypothetical protein RLZZ241_408 [Bacteroidota bacterium]